MAANKFASMLHKNTNRITLILVYAILEWVLILLLLLNSLFSYLIIKFADYFGLKRPCLWCSRLDHFFEPAKFQNSYRSLVCEAHALEISKFGYCFNHRKLAESQDMCEDCLSSHHLRELPQKLSVCPSMKEFGVLKDSSDGDNDNKVSETVQVAISKCCSCCSVGLDATKPFYPGDYVINPSLGDFEITRIENFACEVEIDDEFEEKDDSHRKRSGYVCDRCGEEQRIDENREAEDRKSEEKTEEEFSCFISSFDCKEMVADGENKDDIILEHEQKLAKNDDLSVSVDDRSCGQAVTVQTALNKEMSKEIQPQHLEFYIDQDDCLLIPVELMESSSSEKQIPGRDEKGQEGNCGSEDFVLEFDSKHVGTQYELVTEERSSSQEKAPLPPIQECEEELMVDEIEPKDLMENEKESSSGVNADYESVKEDMEQVDIWPPMHMEQVDISQPMQTSAGNDHGIHEFSEVAEEERESRNDQEALQLQSDEIDADVSIGTEIPDHEPIECLQIEEFPSSCGFMGEDLSTSNEDHNGHGYKQTHEDAIEFSTTAVEACEPLMDIHLPLCSESNDAMEFSTTAVEACEPVMNIHLPIYSENNDVEDDKSPDTPTSVDSLHHLHQKFLVERRESSTEESLDGSVLSDIEAGDGVSTVEKLKSALRCERKASKALYSELEEERSASAVAANQTMAMINRLQEEKAAMQMEALQYQRMMEEQSEYDQEALQLLNELMIKREKERTELEKELESCRKKVQDYEAKEKLAMLKRRKESSIRSGTSSASYSNTEDSDGLSVDLNHEPKEEDCLDSHQKGTNQNTPIDAVVYWEESLNDFEVERLSILAQLKVLEEKLFTLSDEEEQHFEDINSIEHLHKENGYNEDSDHGNGTNGFVNGHYKEMNGKHHQERKTIGTKAKRLLPLFDAIDAESEDGMLNGHEEDVDSIALLKSSDKFDIDNKKLALEEEVDHVYERLQALEADKEFLKHCITSLRKGDKGIELLQEILQHLRDLRSVELRARNMEDVVS